MSNTPRQAAGESARPITLGTLNRVLVAVVVGCVVAMVAGTYYTFVGLPPVPDVVRTEDGATLFTQEELTAGKEVFHKYNLMSYGTLLGNGAYYGPDYTAEYLRFVSEEVAGDTDGSVADEGTVGAVARIRASRLDDGVLVLPDAWARAHRRVQEHYRDMYVRGRPEAGVGPGTIPTAGEADRLAHFIGWSAWIAVAQRPGSDGSYTNNWPHDPSLGNTPTPTSLFWTAATIAIVLLLAALIAVVYGAVRVEPVPRLPAATPGQFEVTPAQRAVIPLFAIGVVLFFVQTLAGGYIANAFASRQDFYGLFAMLELDRATVLPFSALRAVHVDLGVFWVLGLWMASALYLAPFLGGRAARWVAPVSRLMTLLIVVGVLGTVVGIYAAVRDLLGGTWYWLGTEGMEYVDMGRAWKYAIAAAFALWVAALVGWYRGIMGKTAGHIQRVLFGIAVAISAAFLPSLAFLPSTHFVVADFWRWWTVHLWVEGIFAFFQVALTAIVFLNLGLVDRETVTKTVYLEGILVVLAGTFAVGHHYWWIGEPAFWISIGSVFSSLEVVPLFFLLFQALATYREAAQRERASVHRVALWFLVAGAVWQFIGSGVLGLIINFPIINYYEHGTYLTVAHAHGAFLGGFGFLAIGLMLYGLRYLVPDGRWPDRPLRWTFYLLNAGLSVMLLVSVVPVGLMQLNEAVTSTYETARSLAFYEQPVIETLMKLRMPGDTLIILGAGLLALQVARIVRAGRRAGGVE